MVIEIIEQQKKIIKSQEYFMLIFAIILIGMLMNFVVLINNGGRMPVLDTFSWETSKHFSYQDFSEIKYPLFSDRFSFLIFIFSIGDLVMISGFLVLSVFLVKIVRQKNKLKKLYREWQIKYK